MAATLKVRFLADTAGFSAGVKGANGDLTGFEKATKTVSANIGKALGAISFVAVVKGLTDMAKNAQEDQIAQDLLANQIRNTTNATDEQVQGIADYIDKVSKQYGIVDDKLRPAMSRLVTVTGDTTEAQKLFQLALDASAATGKPLESVAVALGKAYNGQFASLNKLGIPMLDSIENAKNLTKESKNLASKQLEYNYAVEQYGVNSKEAKKAAEKVADIQAKINGLAQEGTDWQKDLGEAFKGAAEKGINPMERLKVVFDEAKETIGYAFLPVLEKVINALTPIVDKLAPTLAKLIDALAPVFIQLVDALLPLVEQLLPPLVELISALMPVLLPIIQILTDLLVPIIKIVVAVFKGWLGYFKPIIDFVVVLVKAFKTGFGAIVDFVKGPINFILGAIEAYFNFVIKGVNILIGGINTLLKGVNAVTGLKLKVPLIGAVKIPRLADGGVVMPSPGGSIVNVAEAGKPEAIIPLDRMGNMGGNTYIININKASITGREIVQAIQQYQTGQGRVILNG